MFFLGQLGKGRVLDEIIDLLGGALGDAVKLSSGLCQSTADNILCPLVHFFFGGTLRELIEVPTGAHGEHVIHGFDHFGNATDRIAMVSDGVAFAVNGF